MKTRSEKNIVVLISGRGSNLRAVVEACAAEHWPARIAGVASDRQQAAGLAYARECGIPTACVQPAALASREAFCAELARAVDAWSPDVVVLAGFMRILSESFVRRFEGRLINVHPSLLPAFAGLHTHRRAIEAGCKLAGASVHFVSPGLDAGPIIAQAVVPVLADDDEASLAARVLAREHVLLPLALGWLLRGDLRIEGAKVFHTGGAPQALL
ncbi:MAG: phosphoribosylglycinamide formyltransferase [Burkholderiaceae bacterium]